MYPVVELSLSETISSDNLSLTILSLSSLIISVNPPVGIVKSISTIPNKSPTFTQYVKVVAGFIVMFFVELQSTHSTTGCGN